MKNKTMAIILVFMITILNFKIVKPAQAFVPVIAAEAVYYIAAAMVGAGAVGTLIPSDGTSLVTGTLGTEARVIYDGLSVAVQSDLRVKLQDAKLKGYMMLSEVTGLYTALHTAFTTSTMIPKTAEWIDSTGGNLPTGQMTAELPIGMKLTGTWSNGTIAPLGVMLKNSSGVWQTLAQVTYTLNFGAGYVYYIGTRGTGMLSIYNDSACTSLYKDLGNYAYGIKLINNWGIAMYLGVSAFYPDYVTDGTESRPISYPQSPADLSNATKTTVYPNTAGVSGTSVTSPQGMQTGDNIATQLPIIAGLSAEEAIRRALALGHSQASSNGAGAVAYNDIMAGTSDAVAQADAVIEADRITAMEIAGTAVPDVATPLITGAMAPIPIVPMGLTLQRLLDMDTSVGIAPKVTIPLNAMINCFEGLTHIHSPFPQDDYVLIDFGYLDTFQFAGASVMDYFRGIIGFSLIIMTWLYCYRKMYSGQVV